MQTFTESQTIPSIDKIEAMEEEEIIHIDEIDFKAKIATITWEETNITEIIEFHSPS